MIKFIQLDPNGLCNAGCWFCPVSTLGNPPHQVAQMPIHLFESAIKQIVQLKGDLIDSNLHFIYGSHYNEVLLYKHFEEMLQVLKKYKLTLCLLTNGTPLTPKKVDLINKYPGTVSMIAVNAPVYEKELFEKRTGMKEHLFDKLITNISYAFKNLPKHVLLLQINGINELSNVKRLKNFPDLTVNELEKQVSLARSLFPGIKITQQHNLIDRAGLLTDVMVNKLPKNREVLGCASKRDTEWLHISPKGDVFLCCNDFEMEYTYGNINDTTIKDIWLSEKRKQVNDKAFKEICTQCASAIFK